MEQILHEAEKKKSEIRSIEAVTQESQEVIDRAVEVSENIQKLKNLQNSEKEALTDLVNEKNQLSKEITEIQNQINDLDLKKSKDGDDDDD